MSPKLPKIEKKLDASLPEEVKEMALQWAMLLNLVGGFFQGDPNKTILWFSLPNPLLGNISPRDMIRLGYFNKLRNFVVNSLSGELIA